MASPQNPDEYYMALCLLLSEDSPDTKTKVGACVVNSEGSLLGIGYNDLPTGCSSQLPMLQKKHCKDHPLDHKLLYVCHAELNAIVNSKGSLKNGTIYCTLFPCNECAKLIIQHGIKKIVYLDDKHSAKDTTKASKRMLDLVGVECRQFSSKRTITIDFSKKSVFSSPPY
ncbi:probable deoxycytidylate deaminase [Zophobas morio]|uniref:probable deoxycytidylate deaminase n=1 Tax=Zophobas morio TaxID=2755281 RepID=UPI003082F470